MKGTIFILAFVIFYFVSQAQQTESFVDSRDNRLYKTIRIGTQTWMAQNLAYKTSEGCWAYNNNDSNIAIYGYLYTWDSANKACPSGWHLPSDEEWKTLEKTLGMSEIEANIYGSRGEYSNVGGKLKSISNWDNSYKATDEYGFSALPAGNYGSNEKTFYFIGQNAMFWTNTDFKSEFAWYRDLHNDDGKIFRAYRSKVLAFSIRCVKD